MCYSWLKKETLQSSRQYDLDLLKALAIISMIICHCVFRLGMHHPGYEQDVRYLIGDSILGDYIAVAHAFMFAMGVGITFSKKNGPDDLIRRGVHLYVLAFVLNFLRYGIYALADGLIEGEFMAETVYAFIAQDILHFAGLALIATGLFKRLKLNEVHMFAIGLLLSAIGAPLAFEVHGGYVFNYLLGHFITTTEECSCFVFFNWYLFVGVGLLFGAVLRRTGDTDRFYRGLLSVSAPVMAVYIALTVIFGMFFMTKNGWYYALSIPDAAGLLSIDLTLLSAFHFLLKKVNASRLAPFITMSRNVKQIYCIHWCILGFVDSVFCYLLEIVFPYPLIYLFSVILIFISYWLAKGWMDQHSRHSIGSTAASESTAG